MCLPQVDMAGLAIPWIDILKSILSDVIANCDKCPLCLGLIEMAGC